MTSTKLDDTTIAKLRLVREHLAAAEPDAIAQRAPWGGVRHGVASRHHTTKATGAETMSYKHLNVTIYARTAKQPLIGDEHYPDGCAGVLVRPILGSLTATQAMELAADFASLAATMQGERPLSEQECTRLMDILMGDGEHKSRRVPAGEQPGPNVQGVATELSPDQCAEAGVNPVPLRKRASSKR